MHSNPLKSYNRSIQTNQQTLISKIKHQTIEYNQCTIQSCFYTSYQTKYNYKLKLKIEQKKLKGKNDKELIEIK